MHAVKRFFRALFTDCDSRGRSAAECAAEQAEYDRRHAELKAAAMRAPLPPRAVRAARAKTILARLEAERLAR